MRFLMLTVLIAVVVTSGARAQGMVEYGLVTGSAGTGAIGAGGLAPNFSGISGIGGAGGGGGPGGIGGIGGAGGGGSGGSSGGGSTGASSAGFVMHDPGTITYVKAQIAKRSANRVYALAEAQFYHRHDHLTSDEAEAMTVEAALQRSLSPCPECVPPATQKQLDAEKKAGRKVVPQYKAYLARRYGDTE